MKPPCKWLKTSPVHPNPGRHHLLECQVPIEFPELPVLPISIQRPSLWPPKRDMVCRQYCEMCPLHERRKK